MNIRIAYNYSTITLLAHIRLVLVGVARGLFEARTILLKKRNGARSNRGNTVCNSIRLYIVTLSLYIQISSRV